MNPSLSCFQAKIAPEAGSAPPGSAAALTRDQTRARLPAALEVYSSLRVPEGHALVDLSESRAAFSTPMRIRMAVNEMWRVSAYLGAMQIFFSSSFVVMGGAPCSPFA